MHATLTSWLGPQRPKLRQVPLADVLPARRGQCFIPMSVGQWDRLLATAYGLGWVLLELDDDERPIRAFQSPAPEAN
jgi:hypothetical protein